MTGDRRYFSSIDKSITGKIKFGDDSHIDIKGKGSISFIEMNGEPRTITGVYYIPDVRSNIISLGQTTESVVTLEGRETTGQCTTKVESYLSGQADPKTVSMKCEGE